MRLACVAARPRELLPSFLSGTRLVFVKFWLSSVDVKLAQPVGRRVLWVTPSVGLSMADGLSSDVECPLMEEGRRCF